MNASKEEEVEGQGSQGGKADTSARKRKKGKKKAYKAQLDPFCFYLDLDTK